MHENENSSSKTDCGIFVLSQRKQKICMILSWLRFSFDCLLTETSLLLIRFEPSTVDRYHTILLHFYYFFYFLLFQFLYFDMKKKAVQYNMCALHTPQKTLFKSIVLFSFGFSFLSTLFSMFLLHFSIFRW